MKLSDYLKDFYYNTKHFLKHSFKMLKNINKFIRIWDIVNISDVNFEIFKWFYKEANRNNDFRRRIFAVQC